MTRPLEWWPAYTGMQHLFGIVQHPKPLSRVSLCGLELSMWYRNPPMDAPKCKRCMEFEKRCAVSRGAKHGE